MNTVTELKIKRTMLGKSIMEEENSNRLNYMIPCNIPGRHQILTKLKDLIVPISSVEVIPIHALPASIDGVIPFFATDRYSTGNFIAYGVGVDGKEKLLWDDETVVEMSHIKNSIDVEYLKKCFIYSSDVVILTCRYKSNSSVLNIYYYKA